MQPQCSNMFLHKLQINASLCYHCGCCYLVDFPLFSHPHPHSQIATFTCTIRHFSYPWPCILDGGSIFSKFLSGYLRVVASCSSYTRRRTCAQRQKQRQASIVIPEIPRGQARADVTFHPGA